MKARFLVVAAVWVAAFSLACSASQPVSHSAQVGSTVLIPLAVDSYLTNVVTLDHVGFGGTDQADPQRGQLVVVLEETGQELTTRRAFLAEPVPESDMADSRAIVGRSLILVVDILPPNPSDPPIEPGKYHLELLHRFDDPETPGAEPDVLALGMPYFGELEVLPDVVEVPREDIGPGEVELVVGESTANEYAKGEGTSYWDHAFDPQAAMPRPSFEIQVRDLDGALPDPSWVAYARIEVPYPQDEIRVVDVVAVEPKRSQVWYRDDPPAIGAVASPASHRTLTIETVAFSRIAVDPAAPAHAAVADMQMSPVRVVFELVEPGAKILDLSEVPATLRTARDESGAVLYDTDDMGTVTVQVRDLVANTAVIR